MSATQDFDIFDNEPQNERQEQKQEQQNGEGAGAYNIVPPGSNDWMPFPTFNDVAAATGVNVTQHGAGEGPATPHQSQHFHTTDGQLGHVPGRGHGAIHSVPALIPATVEPRATKRARTQHGARFDGFTTFGDGNSDMQHPRASMTVHQSATKPRQQRRKRKPRKQRARNAQPMTQAERRLEARKARNRASAALSRERRRKHVEQLESSIAHLRHQSNQLKQHAASLLKANVELGQQISVLGDATGVRLTLPPVPTPPACLQQAAGDTQTQVFYDAARYAPTPALFDSAMSRTQPNIQHPGAGVANSVAVVPTVPPQGGRATQHMVDLAAVSQPYPSSASVVLPTSSGSSVRVKHVPEVPVERGITSDQLQDSVERMAQPAAVATADVVDSSWPTQLGDDFMDMFPPHSLDGGGDDSYLVLPHEFDELPGGDFAQLQRTSPSNVGVELANGDLGGPLFNNTNGVAAEQAAKPSHVDDSV